ncbi:MAG: FAD-binding domain-containing protein [Candidatus Methylacidiphilales bacterium]|nr:FAD-binding domain-containing protein [Candidatus Methylacidiphilales bacterium]
MILPPPGPDREASVRRLATLLEGLYAGSPADARPGVWVGGRNAALAQLRSWTAGGYAATRNSLLPGHGNVSRLSPYLRHGVLTLREVAEHVRHTCTSEADRVKFWAELGWRQFWLLVRRARGDAIYHDLEPPKVPLGEERMPDDIAEGRTGLACMDAFVKELTTTGWLHNHARLWFAAYVVHFRKVRWQEGERFFYRHLLDGDPASNALSWQWVASTFSHKPYIFNRDNLEHHTRGVHCRTCTAACPFQASYPELERRLFGKEPGHD